MSKKIDLRMNEWKEAIVKISNAIENCPLTNRALTLLINDSTKTVGFTQIKEVLDAIPKLKDRYLKE